MLLINLFIYSIAVYGVTNIVVHSNGPFFVCKKWRQFTHSIHPAIGELFSCMMCFSTWVGLILSVIDNQYITTNVTPFNTLLHNENKYMIYLMDMFFASGITWLIHQVEELIERTNPAYFEED